MLKYHGRGGSGECSESLLTGSMAAVDKRYNQLLNFSNDLLRCRVTKPIGKKQRGRRGKVKKRGGVGQSKREKRTGGMFQCQRWYLVLCCKIVHF